MKTFERLVLRLFVGPRADVDLGPCTASLDAASCRSSGWIRDKLGGREIDLRASGAGLGQRAENAFLVKSACAFWHGVFGWLGVIAHFPC